MSILIVDDEKEVRESLESILNREGYEVVTASNAKEALDYLRNATVRMMLVDFSMPGMNGEELILALEKEDNPPPALVVTAMAPWKLMNLIKAGVGYIRKPVNSRLLLDTMESILGREKCNGHSVAC
jgi:DNA-binding response OmpR family regulator